MERRTSSPSELSRVRELVALEQVAERDAVVSDVGVKEPELAEDHRAEASVVAHELERDEVVHVRRSAVAEVARLQVLLVEERAEQRLRDPLLLELRPRRVERGERRGGGLRVGFTIELRAAAGRAGTPWRSAQGGGAPRSVVARQDGVGCSPHLQSHVDRADDRLERSGLLGDRVEVVARVVVLLRRGALVGAREDQALVDVLRLPALVRSALDGRGCLAARARRARRPRPRRRRAARRRR